MQQARAIGCLLVFLTVAASNAVCAGVVRPVQTKAPASKSPALPDDPVSMLLLSEQLIVYGERKQDPLAYLLAAKMQKELGMNGDQIQIGYKSLLDKAKAITENRPDIVALAKSIDEASNRGTEGKGWEEKAGSLPSRQSIFLTFEFKGREQSRASVTPDRRKLGGDNLSDLDVDLYVRDAQGNLVCKSEGPGMPDACQWVPERAGKFTIELANRSGTEIPVILSIR